MTLPPIRSGMSWGYSDQVTLPPSPVARSGPCGRRGCGYSDQVTLTPSPSKVWSGEDGEPWSVLPHDICHAMRERRLCLWTASRGSPFRLDFEEAYFNISWSPEMLVPLSGGMALQYRNHACPDPNRYRSNRCEPYGTKVGLSAKPFWHIAIMTNRKPSRPSAQNVPVTELMTSRLQYKRRRASELGALNYLSSRPKDREDG